jgi:hypothetical protein
MDCQASIHAPSSPVKYGSVVSSAACLLSRQAWDATCVSSLFLSPCPFMSSSGLCCPNPIPCVKGEGTARDGYARGLFRHLQTGGGGSALIVSQNLPCHTRCEPPTPSGAQRNLQLGLHSVVRSLSDLPRARIVMLGRPW